MRLRRRPVADRPPSIPDRWLAFRVRAVTCAGVLACGALAGGSGWLNAVTSIAISHPGSAGDGTKDGWLLSWVLIAGWLACGWVVIRSEPRRRREATWWYVMRRTYHPANRDLRRLGAIRYAVSVEHEDEQVRIVLVSEFERTWRRRGVRAVAERVFTGADVADAAIVVEEFRADARRLEAQSLADLGGARQQGELHAAEAELQRARDAARAVVEGRRQRARDAEAARQQGEERQLRQVRVQDAEALARALRSRSGG